MSAGDLTPAPLKPTITIDVVDSIDVRVGTIQAVEDIHGSNKLMRLKVDFGDHTRNILAGIKGERADPHEIVRVRHDRVGDVSPPRRVGFNLQQIREEVLIESPQRCVTDGCQPRGNSLRRIVADALDIDRQRARV